MRMTMKMMTLIMRLAMVDDDHEGENELNDHEDINYHYDLEGDHNEVALGQHNIIVLTILFICL